VKEGVYKGGGHAHCAHTGVHVGEDGGGGGGGGGLSERASELANLEKD